MLARTGAAIKAPRQKVDLAKQSLPGLIKLCYEEGVIKQDLFNSFIKHHRTENMLKFIELFQKEDVDSF
jgi:hypothetical protein